MGERPKAAKRGVVVPKRKKGVKRQGMWQLVKEKGEGRGEKGV